MPDASPDPRRAPRRSSAPWLWGGGAVLALVAGGIAIGVANSTLYSPEAQVQGYLEALAAGDGGTALALSAGGSGDGSSSAPTAALAPGTATSLLHGEPLQAGLAALGELTVTRGADAPDGESTEVAVGYTVDGEDHSTLFTVQRTGRDWLFFDHWRMAPVPLQTVRVAPGNLPPEAVSGPVTAVVNGVQTPLVARVGEEGEGGEGGGTLGQVFAALPPLVVDAEFESTYLAAEPVRLVVDQTAPAPLDAPTDPAEPAGPADPADQAEPAEPLMLELALQYTDAVAEEVNRQLEAYLAGCTEQKVLHPSGCPMGYDTVNRIPPDTIAWSVPGDPQATVIPLPAEGEDPTVMAPLQAEAELSLQEIDLISGERLPVVHRDPFTLEADLAVTGESVRLTPRVP
ncbi:hypothetical protein [Microbacterium sp. A93]|uniref:hypothetical protein n=1 Tax=Microbacterium sp. A93 TaxID=3450716 RepID=UPI003F431928